MPLTTEISDIGDIEDEETNEDNETGCFEGVLQGESILARNEYKFDDDEHPPQPKRHRADSTENLGFLLLLS